MVAPSGEQIEIGHEEEEDDHGAEQIRTHPDGVMSSGTAVCFMCEKP